MGAPARRRVQAWLLIRSSSGGRYHRLSLSPSLMNLDALNALDDGSARQAFGSCCSSSGWVDRMVADRPFKDSTVLLVAAEEVWWDLGADDWHEAFGAHDSGSDEYSDRFGHPYVVFANGRSDEDLAALYRERLERDPLSELQTSAVEQARSTNRRLRELLDLV